MSEVYDTIAVISTVAFFGVQAYLLYKAPIAWIIELAAVMALNWSRESRKRAE